MASLDQSSLERLSQDLYLEIQGALTLKDNVALNQTSKTLALRPLLLPFVPFPSALTVSSPITFRLTFF